ncbi:MAG: hypothetical protein Q9181_006543, partial [Wetmoreana brouardii]
PFNGLAKQLPKARTDRLAETTVQKLQRTRIGKPVEAPLEGPFQVSRDFSPWVTTEVSVSHRTGFSDTTRRHAQRLSGLPGGRSQFLSSPILGEGCTKCIDPSGLIQGYILLEIKEELLAFRLDKWVPSPIVYNKLGVVPLGLTTSDRKVPPTSPSTTTSRRHDTYYPKVASECAKPTGETARRQDLDGTKVASTSAQATNEMACRQNMTYPKAASGSAGQAGATPMDGQYCGKVHMSSQEKKNKRRDDYRKVKRSKEVTAAS